MNRTRKVVNGKRLTEAQSKKFDYFMEKSPEFKAKFEKLMDQVAEEKS